MASTGLPQSSAIQLNKIQTDHSTTTVSRTSHRCSQSLNEEEIVVFTLDQATAAHQLDQARPNDATDNEDITVMSE